MPLAQRSVVPKSLGCTGPACLQSTDHRLIPVEVANQALVKALQQLTCLVRHADDIFCDIAEECQKVVEKTERIQDRISSLSIAVEDLNYKDVPIPEGDLKVFCQKENTIDHFQAKHGYDGLLFTPDERPQCIKDSYNMAMVNPIQIIRRCDDYRRDGLHGSMLFKQWPVVVREPKAKTPELSLRKLPVVTSFEKEYKPLKLRNIVIKRTNSSEQDEEKGDEPKPDTTVVPIDTSGVAFQRMRSFRLSLRSSDDTDQEETTLSKNTKRKRRQTFSGVPQNVWKEICAFESSKLGNKRNSIQDKLKSYSFDDLDSQPLIEEGEIMKYLNQVEERIEEREELENSQSENKFLRLIPCRRSCSLPRSAKLLANRNKSQHSRPLSKCEAKSETGLATLATLRASSCGSSLSLHSIGSVASSRQSRSTKRSSIIGVKIRSLISGGSKPHSDTRPKSLDLDALDPEPSEPRRPPANELNRTPSMPEGMLENVGPGSSFYYFESNTLPKTQAKKYDFPWESLPKDWTTSVKLREISKRKVREDRNSSSGNWSGSSARQSLESERAKSLRVGCSSQKSLDSGRESPTPTADGTTTDTAGSMAGDEGSLMTGDTGESCSDARTRYSNFDTETWLRNLAIRAAARDDSSSSSETLASLAQLSKQNLDALDGELSGDIADRFRLDDDASSVYSLDQEGFYTSFHNDSGLRRSTTTLWEEDEAISSPIDDNDKSHSVYSMSSNLSVDSVIYKPSLEVPSPVIMRPPQKRQNSSGADSDGSAIFNLPAPTPQPSLNPTVDFSFSESDQELIYARVKQKTRIPAAMMYPSMCEVSSSDSEEDGTLKPKSVGLKHKPMFDPEEVAVVELSPGLKSSLGVDTSHNGFSMDSKHGSTSQTLSTFSSSGSSAPSGLDIKGSSTGQTISVFSTTASRPPLTVHMEQESTSRTLSCFSSSGSRSSSKHTAHPTLKHSGSLDDSNLLGSANKDKTDQKEVFNSLPRHYHLYKRPSFGGDNTNSWPRSRQAAHDLSLKPQPSSGILKSKQKTSNGPKTPKTLNFAPVVNMFDPGTPEAVQVLLSTVGNSPIREVNPPNLPQSNSFKAPTEEFGIKTVKNETYRPVSSGSESDIACEAELPSKYLPTLIVRPGSRSAEPKNASSKSDISPYATSSLTRNFGKKSIGSSMGSSISSAGDSEDHYMYRKGLVTSPTVDSGIGSVGDLSPSTPTSSIEGYDDAPKTRTSLLSDTVFTSQLPYKSTDNTSQTGASITKEEFLSKSYENYMVNSGPKRGAFGQNLQQNNMDIEFADDSDETPDMFTSAQTQELIPPAPKSVTSTLLNTTNGHKDKRASSSDSKLLEYSRNTRVFEPSSRSSSSLRSAFFARTPSPNDQSANQDNQSDKSALVGRTSSYRNACTDVARAASYRLAQTDLTPHGNGVDDKKSTMSVPASNYRSDSYRVACKDIVPPTIEDHRRADSYRLATKAGAKARELQQQDTASRAESYRHAVDEVDDLNVFEYKPVNKRAAITSLDQLLPQPVNGTNGNGSKGLKSPKQIKRSITESGFFARFRGKADKSTSKLNGSSAGPVKGSYVPLGLPDSVDLGSKQKSPSYRFKPKSSTYVSFDVLSSVEEVKEDSMGGSLESVKAPSLSSLQSFQSGQSNPFLRRHTSSETLTEDHQPLVNRRSQPLITSKSHSHVIKATSSDRRRSTGSNRVNGGPHVASSYRSFNDDSSIETGV